MREIGTRVIAIRNSDAEKVYIFGRGVYQGEVEFTGMGCFGEMTYPCTPKIVLDNGKVVYGCQCWWGEEGRAMLAVGMRDIVEVDIDEYLKECKKEKVIVPE